MTHSIRTHVPGGWPFGRRTPVALLAAASLVAALLLAAPATGPARAQTDRRAGIAAVVDDRVITITDVRERARVSAFLATGELPDDGNPSLLQQALQQLIDEALQAGEAERRGISLTEEEEETAIRRVAEANGMSLDALQGMIRESGLPSGAVTSRILNQALWSKTLAYLRNEDVIVTERELERERLLFEQSRGRPEWLLEEIFVRAILPEEKAGALGVARQIIAGLREGTPAGQLIRRFSLRGAHVQATRPRWTSLLPPALTSALERMQPGEISHPVETVNGFYILSFAARRIIGQAPPDMDIVTVKQFVMTLPLFPAPGDAELLTLRAGSLRERTRGCDGIDAMAREEGQFAPVLLARDRPLGSLAPEEVDVLINAPAGRFAAPLVTRYSIRLLMICSREPVRTTPDDAELEERVIARHLSREAGRVMDRLRRGAIIDIRPPFVIHRQASG